MIVEILNSILVLHSFILSAILASLWSRQYFETLIFVDTAYKQQRLPSWRPILHVQTALPIFFGIAVVFIPLGIVLVIYSSSTSEYIIDYTKCKAIAFYRNGTLVWNASDGAYINWTFDSSGSVNDKSSDKNLTCDNFVNDTPSENGFAACICVINFMLPVSFKVRLQ